MANSSTPSRAPRKAPQRKVHRYIDALVSDDFGRLAKLMTRSANSFARKKLDTASQSLQLKGERNEKKARGAEIREWRAAERSVAAELREADHRYRLLWRSLKTKVRPDKKLKHTPPKEPRRDWPYASVALPKYDGPVIDRRGQRGVFARFRYYSRRTAKAGVSSRAFKYCFNGAELDIDGNPYVATNVGMTIDEALCGFDHLEQVNWSAARNAKVLMHGIFAVDHRQSPDQMMTCGIRWAEQTLGRFDLPYLVTLHAPPPDGDERNWHLHILWSYRPLVRTGDHEWRVGEMLRTDLDNPAGMKLLREMFAEVMTEMSFEAGQNQVYTAKSNAARGLPHEPQVHLGAANTIRVRKGEYVAQNEENHERLMRSKAVVIDDVLRHADAALARASNAVRAFQARWARLPVLPMTLPKPVVAASMSLPPLERVSLAILSPAKIVLPALPKAPPRAASAKIANLRIQPLALATARIDQPAPAPARPAQFRPLMLPAFSPTALPAMARDHVTIAVPTRHVVPAKLDLPAFSPSPLPPFADTELATHAVQRAKAARREYDERRKHERTAAERAAVEARAVLERREALDRLLLTIEHDRHYTARRQGRYAVDPVLLVQFGLSERDVVDDPVQERLARIAERHNGELARIQSFLLGKPNLLRLERGRWMLDDAAPDDLRDHVRAWRHDSAVQAAFARLAAAAVPAEAGRVAVGPGISPEPLRGNQSGMRPHQARPPRDQGRGD